MSRVVCVSSRIAPPRRAAVSGGLAIGVLAALRQRGGLWFGWSGETSQGDPDAPNQVVRDGIAYATIDLPEAIAELYYDGFANGTLWPLFHYFLGSFHYDVREFEAYDRVNALFARRLTPLLAPYDIVWVHDYHLIPLAEKLRAAGVMQPIGLFFHIPFPQLEVLRALPVYAELMRALLAYNLVGFQTETDRRGFLGAVAALWGAGTVQDDQSIRYGGRRVLTGVFPIGVDVDGIARVAKETQSSDAVQRMVRGLLQRRLVIGVDRLDYSKGLVERFAAYEQFLESNPEQIGQVTYLQIAPLSRPNVSAYAELRATLERATGRTNGRFADTDWTPIRYLNRNFPHDTLMGFLRAAQVCLVTPARDGMNLIAKEFIAAQEPDDPGVLILSKLAGAAVELVDALLVNPYDGPAISRAIQQALTMPLAERRERHQRLVQVLRANDIAAWHSRFIDCLQSGTTTAASLPSS